MKVQSDRREDEHGQGNHNDVLQVGPKARQAPEAEGWVLFVFFVFNQLSLAREAVVYQTPKT